jgi:hypothetical protein
MKAYLDDLEQRMNEANTCEALRDAAQEAMDSLQQGMDDAQKEINKLVQLIIPPTTLPGVIIWIKAQIDLYKPPYEAYLEQLSMYAEQLQKIQQLLSDKVAELACKDQL